MGVCGAAEHEGSGPCDGVKLGDCLREVPQPNIHNCEYQYLAALSAFRPRLERVTYRIGDRRPGRVSPRKRCAGSLFLIRRMKAACTAIVDRFTFGGNIIETGTGSYRLTQADGDVRRCRGWNLGPRPPGPGLPSRSGRVRGRQVAAFEPVTAY